MCTFVLQNGTLWDNFSDELWDLWDGSIVDGLQHVEGNVFDFVIITVAVDGLALLGAGTSVDAAMTKIKRVI